eukprot:g3732.t1
MSTHRTLMVAITNPYDYRYPCTKNATNHTMPGVDAAGNKYGISWDNCKYDTKTKYEEAEAAKTAKALADQLAQLTQAIDVAYYFLCGCMVFLMQLGFAMVEVGAVSKKNINNIILKGTLDILISALCFWAFGFSVAFGGGEAGSFIGGQSYLFGACLDGADNANNDIPMVPNPDEPGSEMEDPTHPCAGFGLRYEFWFFQFAFAATAATIVSGAVAERTTTLCYVIYSVFLTAFIYPVVVHWQWGGGLTSHWGAVDYAGSGVVHMTGGLAAIVGAAIIGPRRGRFEPTGSPCKVVVNPMPQYSVVFSTLGVLILWFGWYGFNTGSTLGITWVTDQSATSPARNEAGLVMINTTLAPAAAGLTAMMCAALGGLIHGKGFKLYLTPVLNGILAGLVSITAGCGDVSPWAAVMLGAIGGIIYSATSKLQLMLKIDDVVDAGPVHFWCGIWGVLGFALFADDRGTGLTGGVGDESGVYEGQGLFYGGGSLFAHNLALVAMIIIWVAPTMAAVFFILKLANVARVSAEIEEVGLDISKHGIEDDEVTKLSKVQPETLPAP